MATTFKLVTSKDKEDGTATTSSDKATLVEPILASFPSNMPSTEAFKEMQFTIYQQQSKDSGFKSSATKKKNRRVIKAQRKGVKYEAKSYLHDANTKDQASDYYMGVFNSEDNKVYMIPVTNPYQFNQEIDNFKEQYGQEEDNEALKNMSYMDKKVHLVNAFGTKKAIKKVTSMLTNMVEEGGVSS